MNSFKIRLGLVFTIIAFAVLSASAAGTVEITQFTPRANCNNTGLVFEFTLVFTNFTGNFSFRFYVDGLLSHTISEGPFYGPSYFVVSHSRTGIIVGSTRPDHSVYQVILQDNGVTVFDYSWDCSTGQQILPPSPLATGSDETIIPAFTDGRLNRYDAAAPVAIYAHEEGLAIYVIDEHSEGTLAFLVSLEEIEALGIPDENSLLGTSEDGLIALWRLPNGQFMLQAPTVSGKTYYLFFDSIGENLGYISYES